MPVGKTRTEYEISWLDPDYMDRHPDCDLAKAAREEYFDDLACARQAAKERAEKLGTTIQLRRIDISGERFLDDPLAEHDQVGDVEEF